MLKYKYSNRDDIPEEFRDLFTEKNGEWVLTEVTGMRTNEDVQRLQDSLAKERSDHKETKRTLGEYREISSSPEELQAALDEAEELKAAGDGGKIDDEKIEQIVERRIAAKTKPLERTISKLEKELAEKDQTIEQYASADRKRTIRDEMRKACASSKLVDTAVEDALLYGDSVLTLDESGQVVTRDNVGVTPGISPADLLSEIQERRPHWWPESSGIGGRGGKHGGNMGKNPFSGENWNLTEQGNLIRTDRSKAERLAAAAGTTIGGPRPEVEKS